MLLLDADSRERAPGCRRLSEAVACFLLFALSCPQRARCFRCLKAPSPFCYLPYLRRQGLLARSTAGLSFFPEPRGSPPLAFLPHPPRPQRYSLLTVEFGVQW
ncbi:hypothetical protein AAT19DRAFT_9395, partial [Rhodotorula toruloides]